MKTTLSFLEGFRCLLLGLRMAYGRRFRLARYWLLPTLAAVVLVAGGWLLFWNLSDDAVRLVWTEPARDAWLGVQHVLWLLVRLAVFVAAAGLLALSSVSLFSLLTTPVNDLFSERVEGLLGTWEPRPFSLRLLLADAAQGMGFVLVRFLQKLAWLAPLFLLSLAIPVVGQVLLTGVGGYFLCKYTGLDYVDWCAARRGFTWKDRLVFGRANRMALCGLGAGVVLSLLVPFLFVIVWPGAVAGGTILFVRIEGIADGAQVERVLRGDRLAA